jgi:uncharacterized protein
MRFAVICHDKTGALQTRLDNRAAHLAYIQATGVVDQAGPLLDKAGQMCGSLLILSVGSLAVAQDWAAGDPYGLAGLFAAVEVIEWNRVIG